MNTHEPQPPVVNVNVRFPAELHAWLRQEAEREHRSLNSQIIHLLTLTLGKSSPSIR